MSAPFIYLLIPTLVVSTAWNKTYIGDHHQTLLDNINRMSRQDPYSNSVAILQSSGTGKSRMVHEQSDLVFTLPFNLRSNEETKGHYFLRFSLDVL